MVYLQILKQSCRNLLMKLNRFLMTDVHIRNTIFGVNKIAFYIKKWFDEYYPGSELDKPII